MGGKPTISIEGRMPTTLDREVESAPSVASELCRLLLFLVDGRREEEIRLVDASAVSAECRGNKFGKLDMESLSSIMSRVKSTDPFRFRKGLLPAGEDAALRHNIGERLELAALMEGAALALLEDVPPFEVIDRSKDWARGFESPLTSESPSSSSELVLSLVLVLQFVLLLLLLSPTTPAPVPLPPAKLPRDATAKKSSEDSRRRRWVCRCCSC